MLGVGALVGAFNGAAVTRLKMPPFMVTLTTMMFASGLAIWLTQSKNISGLPASFTGIGGRTIVAVFATVAVVALGHAVLTRTLHGRWLYAVGHNPRVAFISGVPVGRVTLLVYVVCGLCAAVASIFYTGRLETGSPVHGQRILLDVIDPLQAGRVRDGGNSARAGGAGKVRPSRSAGRRQLFRGRQAPEQPVPGGHQQQGGEDPGQGVDGVMIAAVNGGRHQAEDNGADDPQRGAGVTEGVVKDDGGDGDMGTGKRGALNLKMAVNAGHHPSERTVSRRIANFKTGIPDRQKNVNQVAGVHDDAEGGHVIEEFRPRSPEAKENAKSRE